MKLIEKQFKNHIVEILGEQFYKEGMKIPLVKKAFAEAIRLRTKIGTCGGMACFSGDDWIQISTDYPLALQLSGFVHEMVHIRCNTTLLKKKWDHVTYLRDRGGIGAQIKFQYSMELLPYKTEKECLEQIPARLKEDKMTKSKETKLNSVPLKRLPFKMFVNNVPYSRFIYNNTKEQLERMGATISKTGKLI